jgi:hypothetical protein
LGIRRSRSSDLSVVDVDQVLEGVEAGHVAVGKVQGVELGRTPEAEHVDPGRQHPVLAHHGMDLGLEATPETDQLQAVADDLAEFAQLRWGDPRLGQATKPEEVDEVIGVPLVVLHPPVPPAVAQRVRQMHPGTHLLEDIRRPVPAERRLQHDLRLRTGRRHRLRQGHRAVLDPNLGQDLTSRVLPHNHRPAPVKINPDVLSFHRGLLLASRGCCFRRPECPHDQRRSLKRSPG